MSLLEEMRKKQMELETPGQWLILMSNVCL